MYTPSASRCLRSAERYLTMSPILNLWGICRHYCKSLARRRENSASVIVPAFFKAVKLLNLVRCAVANDFPQLVARLLYLLIVPLCHPATLRD